VKGGRAYVQKPQNPAPRRWLTGNLIERMMKPVEKSIMPVKSASTRVMAPAAAKAVRPNGAKPRVKKTRVPKLEAKKLESFKVLMEKYRGKATFAGFDE
jgi:hypothetical protein